MEEKHNCYDHAVLINSDGETDFYECEICHYQWQEVHTSDDKDYN